VFLNGNGGIKHIVDEEGSSVLAGQQTEWNCSMTDKKPIRSVEGFAKRNFTPLVAPEAFL